MVSLAVVWHQSEQQRYAHDALLIRTMIVAILQTRALKLLSLLTWRVKHLFRHLVLTAEGIQHPFLSMKLG